MFLIHSPWARTDCIFSFLNHLSLRLKEILILYVTVCTLYLMLVCKSLIVLASDFLTLNSLINPKPRVLFTQS